MRSDGESVRAADAAARWLLTPAAVVAMRRGNPKRDQQGQRRARLDVATAPPPFRHAAGGVRRVGTCRWMRGGFNTGCIAGLNSQYGHHRCRGRSLGRLTPGTKCVDVGTPLAGPTCYRLRYVYWLDRGALTVESWRLEDGQTAIRTNSL